MDPYPEENNHEAEQPYHNNHYADEAQEGFNHEYQPDHFQNYAGEVREDDNEPDLFQTHPDEVQRDFNDGYQPNYFQNHNVEQYYGDESPPPGAVQDHRDQKVQNSHNKEDSIYAPMSQYQTHRVDPNIHQDIHIHINIYPQANPAYDGNNMMQPQMPYNGHIQSQNNYPPTSGNYDVYSSNSDVPPPQQPSQDQSKKQKYKRMRTSMAGRGESKKDTYCFGIFSRRHGCLVNSYRLFCAVLWLPFTIIGLIMTGFMKQCTKCIIWTNRKCCPCCPISEQFYGHGHHHNHDQGLDTLVGCCFDTLICQCKKCSKHCIRCYDETAGCCEACTDGCTQCCADCGKGCGHCIGSVGRGTCDCLEGGKGLFANCIAGIGKLCCLGVEQLEKCSASAHDCYASCCLCRCCCECNIDISQCGNWVGERCNGSIVAICECLQGIVCHLGQVIGNIFENCGCICECLNKILR